MKAKTEKKILEEYLNHKGNPERIEKKYRWLSNTLFVLSLLFVFFYFSDNLKPAEGGHLLTFASFTAGMFFGLGIWFSQMGTQTGIFMRHMSAKSIEGRNEWPPWAGSSRGSAGTVTLVSCPDPTLLKSTAGRPGPDSNNPDRRAA